MTHMWYTEVEKDYDHYVVVLLIYRKRNNPNVRHKLKF